MTVDTAMMGTVFMLVIFMIAMMDYSELKAGLAIATLPAAGLMLTPLAGWLADRLGPRLLGGERRAAQRRRPRRARLPVALGAARAGALALGARRRRPRPHAAGAARLRHERRARRRARRRLRHAQHGAAARLPARRRRSWWPCSRTRCTRRVNHAADQGQALTRAQTGLSQPTKDQPGQGARPGADHQRHRRHQRAAQGRAPDRRGHRQRRRLRGRPGAAAAQGPSREHALGRRRGGVPLAVLRRRHRGADGRGRAGAAATAAAARRSRTAPPTGRTTDVRGQRRAAHRRRPPAWPGPGSEATGGSGRPVVPWMARRLAPELAPRLAPFLAPWMAPSKAPTPSGTYTPPASPLRRADAPHVY